MTDYPQPIECPAMPLPDDGSRIPCAMGDVPTEAKYIRKVTQCTRCGWLDPAALDRWAEQAAKEMLPSSAQRIALAASGDTFAFVESSDQPLTLQAALGQALGAASTCWEFPERAGMFDPSRAKEIYTNLWMFLNEKMQERPTAA